MRYLPGRDNESRLPLERFIQPYVPGPVGRWLPQNLPPGALVLDPFCSNPLFALEAAEAGYRVVVSSNNPVITLLLETIASAPAQDGARQALLALDSGKPSDQRVSSQLRGLYQTTCENCAETTDVDVFLWRKGESLPFEKHYTCTHCGSEQEGELSADDRAGLSRIGNAAMFYSRALSRVDIGDRDVMEGAQEALKSYTPRAIYFIFTLLNRIDGVKDSRQKRLLQAAMLQVMDAGNSLWPWPSTRSRPRLLVQPPQFRERNLWHALEESLNMLSHLKEPITILPSDAEEQPAGSIVLYRGRLKEMLDSAPSARFDSALLLFPRPNQAFWTLSAMWSGWLFGKDGVKPLRGALERERYDWFWLSNSLSGLFKQLRGRLSPQFPAFGMVTDMEGSYAVSVINALKGSPFRMTDIALRTSAGTAQLELAQDGDGEQSRKSVETAARDTIRDVIEGTGEPQTAQRLMVAAATGISLYSDFGRQSGESAGNQFKALTGIIQKLFEDRTFLYPLEDKSLENENAYWGLAGESFLRWTLSDQIEAAILGHLQDFKTLSVYSLDQALCGQFRGFGTPNKPLLMECLESYAEQIAPQTWAIRTQELAQNRQVDMSDMAATLARIGETLAYKVVPMERGLAWHDAKGKPLYRYTIIATSAVSPIVTSAQSEPGVKQCIVLPGSRSRLLTFKLAINKPLADRVDRDWHLIKYRAVNMAADEPSLTAAGWASILDLDQPSHDEPIQMSIFNTLN